MASCFLKLMMGDSMSLVNYRCGKGEQSLSSVGRPWDFGKIQREGTDARCYNLRVRERNDDLNESSGGGALMAWSEGGRQGAGEVSAIGAWKAR